MIRERYDIPTAAAWILGHARRTAVPELPENLRWKTTAECSEDELIQIVTADREARLKLYPFKSGTQTLARTRRTQGFLHSLSFETMLDVGSGRGGCAYGKAIYRCDCSIEAGQQSGAYPFADKGQADTNIPYGRLYTASF